LGSDRILVLKQGRVVEFASPKELIVDNPTSEFACLVRQAGMEEIALDKFSSSPCEGDYGTTDII